jgi:hypothetical protein
MFSSTNYFEDGAVIRGLRAMFSSTNYFEDGAVIRGLRVMRPSLATH